MKKKLITLAKELDFNTEVEYFNYIVDSYINGQKQQVNELFNDMRKDDKRDFLEHVRINCPDYYSYFVNLLF